MVLVLTTPGLHKEVEWRLFKADTYLQIGYANGNNSV